MDYTARQLVVFPGIQRYKPHTIEAEETRIGAQPEIAVAGLGEGGYGVERIAFILVPGGMQVLANRRVVIDGMTGTRRE